MKLSQGLQQATWVQSFQQKAQEVFFLLVFNEEAKGLDGNDRIHPL